MNKYSEIISDRYVGGVKRFAIDFLKYLLCIFILCVVLGFNLIDGNPYNDPISRFKVLKYGVKTTATIEGVFEDEVETENRISQVEYYEYRFKAVNGEYYTGYSYSNRTKFVSDSTVDVLYYIYNPNINTSEKKRNSLKLEISGIFLQIIWIFWLPILLLYHFFKKNPHWRKR